MNRMNQLLAIQPNFETVAGPSQVPQAQVQVPQIARNIPLMSDLGWYKQFNLRAHKIETKNARYHVPIYEAVGKVPITCLKVIDDHLYAGRKDGYVYVYDTCTLELRAPYNLELTNPTPIKEITTIENFIVAITGKCIVLFNVFPVMYHPQPYEFANNVRNIIELEKRLIIIDEKGLCSYLHKPIHPNYIPQPLDVDIGEIDDIFPLNVDDELLNVCFVYYKNEYAILDFNEQSKNVWKRGIFEPNTFRYTLKPFGYSIYYAGNSETWTTPWIKVKTIKNFDVSDETEKISMWSGYVLLFEVINNLIIAYTDGDFIEIFHKYTFVRRHLICLREAKERFNYSRHNLSSISLVTRHLMMGKENGTVMSTRLHTNKINRYRWCEECRKHMQSDTIIFGFYKCFHNLAIPMNNERYREKAMLKNT